ncbi:MAG: barstar family protein, partial [Candidatus Micrarchaeota archaeon]
ATFQNDPSEWQRLDWLILQNGCLSLYWRTELLQKDIEWFKKENYRVVEFDCKSWNSETEMHEQLKKKLNFPDYYGKNFPALNDCLSDLEIIGTGQIVVFHHLDSIDGKTIHILLEIFANNARKQLLFGKRLIVLSQVDNPNFQTDPVGSTPVLWNGYECFDKNRK